MPALTRLFPLLTTLRGHTRAEVTGDVIAGLTTAVMLIPQAMAYAMLAGLDPITGLYASTLPVLAYAVLGTSRQLAVGPVAMVSLLVASGVAPLAGGDTARAAALGALLAGMVGALQWAMGAVRLGFLVRFLSHPVIAGFTSAAALVIAASQLKHVLGLDIPASEHLGEVLWATVTSASRTHLPTLLVAIASLATLTALQRIAPRAPRFLVVVALGTLAVPLLGLDGMGVRTVGPVPAGLPVPSLPSVDGATVRALLPTAITIALVGFLESVSVASGLARKHRYDLDADQELRALGAANLVGAVFQGYPVTGGFSRTAVNDQAGARSGLAAVVTAVAVILTLLFLTPLFEGLPRAVLAAIIISAVASLVQPREAAHLWRVSRPDLALMGLTFVATLALGVEPGIALGVGASLLWFIWQTSAPHVAVLGRLPGTEIYRKLDRNPAAVATPGVLAVRVDAPLYFPNTAFLRTTLRALVVTADVPVRHLVLDATGIGSIDASGLAVLEEVRDDLAARGVTLWLASLRGPVRDRLERAHLLDAIGAEHVVQRVHDAMTAIPTSTPRLAAVG